MIINPFEVNLPGPQRYTFIDRMAIDSPVERQAVELAITAQLQAAQQDAMCAALGLAELQTIPNFGFGVYDNNGNRVGIYLMASNGYQSGPWADLTDWEQTSNDPAIIHGRHMPGFGALSDEDEQDLAAETTYHFLSRRLGTAGGHEIAFQRISWAIFEQRTDPKSMRDRGVHGKIVGDARLRATMLPDQANASLTRVDVELR